MAPRFLVGGWVVPRGTDGNTDPFAETLKTAVITSEEALRGFLLGFEVTLYRGNPEALDRVDFSQELVVAAYYLWRPLKGQPLSILGVVKTETGAELDLELEQDPMGRERPFLMAPLQIVALDRDVLAKGGPVELVFRLNGQVAGKETVALE